MPQPTTPARQRRRAPEPVEAGTQPRPDLEEPRPIVTATTETTDGDLLVKEQVGELEDGRALTRVRKLARGGMARVRSSNTVALGGDDLIEDPVQHKNGCPMMQGRVEAYEQAIPLNAGGGFTTVVRCCDCGESVAINTNTDLE